jgi:acetyl-CoA carboxylase carboxyl transferase subunit beta
MRVAVGKIAGNDIVIACMDFEFIGGSLGKCDGKNFQEQLIIA